MLERKISFPSSVTEERLLGAACIQEESPRCRGPAFYMIKKESEGPSSSEQLFGLCMPCGSHVLIQSSSVLLVWHLKTVNLQIQIHRSHYVTVTKIPSQ